MLITVEEINNNTDEILIYDNIFTVVYSYFEWFLDEQGGGDYFDRTEKNQLFLWGVHTEAKGKGRLNVDLLNNTI